MPRRAIDQVRYRWCRQRSRVPVASPTPSRGRSVRTARLSVSTNHSAPLDREDKGLGEVVESDPMPTPIPGEQAVAEDPLAADRWFP